MSSLTCTITFGKVYKNVCCKTKLYKMNSELQNDIQNCKMNSCRTKHNFEKSCAFKLLLYVLINVCLRQGRATFFGLRAEIG